MREWDEVVEDLQHLIHSLSEDIEFATPGCRVEGAVMLVYPYNRVRMRMIIHSSYLGNSAWSDEEVCQGEGMRIERIDEIELDKLADETELFYLLRLTEVASGFRKTLGTML